MKETLRQKISGWHPGLAAQGIVEALEWVGASFGKKRGEGSR